MKPTDNKTIEAFELGEPLGAGGMSEVFRGVHVSSGQEVAIKVTRFPPGNNVLRRVFVSEIAAMARMHHDAIVPIYDWGTLPDGQGNWCAMELAAGALSIRDVTTWSLLKSLLLQVLDGLAHAHARDVIHRDLKPANILVFPTPGGPRYRLADFGLAHSRLGEHDGHLTGVVTGTPAYMAPEQLHGLWREFGPWTDLYALGCLAFEMACGRLPFNGNSPVEIALAHLNTDRPALTPRFPVPDGFEDWIGELINRDWTRRPSRAISAKHALLQLREATGEFSPEIVSPATAETLDFDLTLMAKTLVDLGLPPAMMIESGSPHAFGLVPIPQDWRAVRTVHTPFSDAGSRLVGLRDTPLVGQEPLRESLWSELQTVATEGMPRVVFLQSGPAGERKRILDWLVRRVREVTSMQVFDVEASIGQGRWDPLEQSLRQVFMAHDIKDSVLEAHVERTLLHLMGESDLSEDIVSVFASGTPHVVRKLFARAGLWSTVSRCAAREPIVLVMRDMGHDPIAWWFAHRAANCGLPVLIVVAPIDKDWPASPPEKRLRLDPNTMVLEPERLTATQAKYVLDSYLKLEPKAEQALIELAMQDISFAIQVMRQGATLGALSPTPDGYELVGVTMPRTVDEASGMRLKALAPRSATAVRAVCVAAVMGTVVTLYSWEEMMARLGVKLLPRHIELLMRHGFVRRVRGAYVFPDEPERVAFGRLLDPEDARSLVNQLSLSDPAELLMRCSLHLQLQDAEAAAETLKALQPSQIPVFAEVWIELSEGIKAALPVGHSIGPWIETMKLRMLRASRWPSGAIEQMIQDRKLAGDRLVCLELQTELATALCYEARLEDAESLCRELLTYSDLSDRIRAEVLGVLGWIEMSTDRADVGEATLAEAVEGFRKLGLDGPAAVYAQHRASMVSDPIVADQRFSESSELAILSMDPAKWPRVILERSTTNVAFGSAKKALEQAQLAARIGQWGIPAMTAAFGANLAICMAATDTPGWERVLQETLEQLLPNDVSGAAQLSAATYAISAIRGDTETWDALVQAPPPKVTLQIFAVLSETAWNQRGDEERAKQAIEQLTAHRPG